MCNNMISFEENRIRGYFQMIFSILTCELKIPYIENDLLARINEVAKRKYDVNLFDDRIFKQIILELAIETWQKAKKTSTIYGRIRLNQSYKDLIELLEEIINIISSDLLKNMPNKFFKFMRITPDNMKQHLSVVPMKKAYYTFIKRFRKGNRDSSDKNDFRLSYGKNYFMLHRFNRYSAKSCALCVSDILENKYLWERYANKHSGICLEITFEKNIPAILDDISINPIISKFCFCKKMEYSNIRQDIFKKGLLKMKKEKSYIMSKYIKNKLAVTKRKNDEKTGQTFEDEREWRFFISKCKIYEIEKEQKSYKKHNGIMVDDFDYYSSIYIGNQMKNREIMSYVKKIAHENNLRLFIENEEDLTFTEIEKNKKNVLSKQILSEKMRFFSAFSYN